MANILPKWAGWAGPRNPKLLLISEAWGHDETQVHKPLVGSSGQEFWRMLGEAIPDHRDLHAKASKQMGIGPGWHLARAEWLNACGIAMTSTFNFQLVGLGIESICETKKENKLARQDLQIQRGLYLREEFLPELSRLGGEIAEAGPNLVVPLGNAATWAAIRASNIALIRGSVALADGSGAVPAGMKVLPSFHPVGVMRQWNQRPIVIQDLMKAWLQAQSPVFDRPKRNVLVSPSLTEIAAWVAQVKQGHAHHLACDIETANGQITCIGFAHSRASALVIPFVDKRKSDWSYWDRVDERIAWGFVRDLLELSTPKLFQNGMYDLQYICKMGILPKACGDDTMLLHHSLFPELQKGLGFLGSIYTNEASWKLMRRRKADTEKKDE